MAQNKIKEDYMEKEEDEEEKVGKGTEKKDKEEKSFMLSSRLRRP